MIKKCLFPAAGYGTRFLPATKSLPKEMLPIVNKPLMHYAVEEAFVAGMQQMCMVTGRNKEAIINYFDVHFELENKLRGSTQEKKLTPVRTLLERCVFSYTRQPQMRGLGDAILCGETLIENQAFGVVLADDLCLSKASGEQHLLKDMVALYERYHCAVVGVIPVSGKERNKYGIVEGTILADQIVRATKLIEKPPANAAIARSLAICGRYILPPQIFSILRTVHPDSRGEVQITDALNILAQRDQVIAYEYQGRRFDCGDVNGYLEAVNYVYRHHWYI